MRNQFSIPIYQRAYDWQEKHCKQLLEDVVNIGQEDANSTHFLGTITYLSEVTDAIDVSTHQVIDGQQRLTTFLLLLKALKSSHNIDRKLQGKIENLLFNLYEDDDKRFKLILTDDDDSILRNILDDNEIVESSNLSINYNYFKTQLNDSNINYVWRGINKLTVVSIMVEKGNNAQAIFESMNSTGLNLSDADMIQNYMLMSYNKAKQKEIYKKYWKPMESLLQRDFGEFLRNYLIMKRGKIIPKNQTYEFFKEYMQKRDREEEIKQMHMHSKYYEQILTLSPHGTEKITKLLQFIHLQDTNVVFSFMLKVLADCDNKILDVEQVEKILLLVDSYLLRCYVCETTKGGNKVFPEMIPNIDEKDYVKSVERILMSKTGNRKFPRDVVFAEKLKQILLYNNRTMCKYILFRLEHNRTKELVDLNTLQIEHIMPKTLTSSWKFSLGDKYEETHELYIDKIGNLTLTGYNQQLSNDIFSNKCKMYKKSNVTITRDLSAYKEWNESTIQDRAERLTKQAIEIWKCPEIKEEFTSEPDTLEEDHLEGKECGNLWETLKSKICSECPGTKFYMSRVYGGFRISTENNDRVLCTMEALKYHVYLGYNTKKDDHVISESTFVNNISTIGHHTLGDFRSVIRTDDDIQKAVELIKNIIDKNK